MEAKLEKIENSEAYIEVEVDEQQLEEGLQQAYLKVRKEVSIPGFRKGKVPRQLLEAHFGAEILYQDALEYIVPGAYEAALEKLEIEPIAQPDFDIDEIEAGKVFRFKAKVAVKPDVVLGELEGLEVSVPEFVVSDEDVDNKLKEMQDRYAQLKEKTEEPAALGDTVHHDFEGFVDGVAFEGGKGENYPLELGSNSFIPGYEEQMVGITTGQEKDINVTFPDEYQSEDLAGKDAVFKVKVNKIETRELRELNDEFAQEVSEFETLDELRQDVKKNLEEMNEARRMDMIKQELIALAVNKCEIPVAEGVVKLQLDQMLYEFEHRMASQGLNLQTYLQITNSTEEDVRHSLRPEAERRIRQDFMLEKLIEEKGIEVSDEEVNKRIEEITGSVGAALEEAKEKLAGMMDKIKAGIQVDKALDCLVEKAVITTTKPDSEAETTSDKDAEEKEIEAKE